MPSYDIQCLNHNDDSNPFESNGMYKNSDLHRRVQSVIRAYRQRHEESKETFSDSELDRSTFGTQRKEELPFEGTPVSFRDQIEPVRKELKDPTSNTEGTSFSDSVQGQQKTSRPDNNINAVRIDVNDRGKELYLEKLQSLAGKSEPFCQGRQANSPLQDRVDEDIESVLSFFRNRLHEYEMGKLRRQSESNLELTTNIYRRLLQNRALRERAHSLFTDSSERAIGVERYEQNDNKNAKAGEQHPTSIHDMDNIRSKLRENLSSVRYRIHSSRALLREHYDDLTTESQQHELRTDSATRFRKHMSSSNQPHHRIEIPERCNLLASVTDELKFEKNESRSEMTEEYQSIQNGWVLYSSKFCEGPKQDPGDLPTLLTNNPNSTMTPEKLSAGGNLSASMDKNGNKSMMCTPKQDSNSSEGMRLYPDMKSRRPTPPERHRNDKSETKSEINRTSFDPFPSNISDSWNDVLSPSDFSSNSLLGTIKSCDLLNVPLSSGDAAGAPDKVEAMSVIKKLESGKDLHDHVVEHEKSSGEMTRVSNGTDANSIIETRETKNAPHEMIMTPTEPRRRTSFLCTNSRPKSSCISKRPKSSETCTSLTTPINNSETSVSTTDRSSTRVSSNCDISAPPSSEQSATSSKNKKYPDKKGKPRRSLISSFSKVNAAKKEWRVDSIGSEHDNQRRRDKKMREWLNEGNTPGDGMVQGCVMETVFYDSRQHGLQDQ